VTNDSTLSSGRYLLRKRQRRVRIEGALQSGEAYFADEEYAVLSRKGRPLLKFSGRAYSPMGNLISFGSFAFLGGKREQFFVSQDIFRGGNQWVISLGKFPRIIYDGDVWAIGREIDDISIIDLDNDGVYEITVPTCSFYGFAGLCPGCTPLPTIVFKYSKRTGKYLPANPRFSRYLLSNIDEQQLQIQSVGSPSDNMNHLGDVMSVVLDYVFAGYEDCGWNFFDEVYRLPDKSQIKADMLKELNVHPVYRYLYRTGSRSKTRLSVDRQPD
jgi:hypothetical protein